jgi:hypothetical protein
LGVQVIATLQAPKKGKSIDRYDGKSGRSRQKKPMRNRHFVPDGT